MQRGRAIEGTGRAAPRASRSCALRRAAALVAGFPLCLLGVLLIPTPFPGAVPFAAGLSLLSGHFRPARRLAVRLRWGLRRLRRGRDETPRRAVRPAPKAEAA